MTKPRWLSPPSDLPKAAAERWKYYAFGLHRAGRLTQENAEEFRFLCVLLGVIGAAAAAIERDGVTIQAQSGGTKSNPTVVLLLRAQNQAAPLLAKFGLSAAGNTGLGFSL